MHLYQIWLPLILCFLCLLCCYCYACLLMRRRRLCAAPTNYEVRKAAYALKNKKWTQKVVGTQIKFQEPQVEIHLDNLVKSIEKRIEEHRGVVLDQPCTIYRVPHEIRSGYEKTYEPMAVSIGPYFHKEQETRPHLKQMWHYKWSCLHNLISQRSELITGSDLIKSCLLKMRELEGRIRCSYSEEIRMSSPDLAEMIMLDGCFILHLVLKYYDQETENVDLNDSNEDWTQVLGRCWIWNLVRYDLLLLENQIPFFVVRELYSIFRSTKEQIADIVMFENKLKQRVNLEITEEQANDIIELERGEERGNIIVMGVQNEDILVIGSLKLFSTLHPCKTNTYFRFKVDQVHHLLHLIYLSILESLEPLPATPPVKETPNWVPSAKELQETGVQFKKKLDAKSFLDIKFTKGVIEIPPLQIYDYSDSLFRNLIAFEQCYPDTKWHVTAYAAFMDCLINTPDDMRSLHLAGVVTNRMTVDQNAANFFSSLCSHAHYSNEWNYLRNVLIEVNKYHGLTWHQWRAGFVRDYCSTPWIIISIIVASFLIVLAIIQTFFSVYAYFKPPN